ncbi:MAG: hypothetical protein ACXIUV_03475 [Alkalilacustris sp.]
MSDPVLRRATRAAVSLHRTGLLAPMAGLAVVGASVTAMQALATAFPETAVLASEIGSCNPFQGDFGCGHGLGCACHLLPEPSAFPA